LNVLTSGKLYGVDSYWQFCIDLRTNPICQTGKLIRHAGKKIKRKRKV